MQPAQTTNRFFSTERTAYTKKLNELKKSREELVTNLKSAKERVKMTKELLAEDASDESYTAPQTRNSSSVRIPTLPSFRGTEKGAIDDAFDFLDKCKYIFEANLVPKDRWLPALLTTLTSGDRQWAAANLKNLPWEKVETEFLNHFESPVIRDQLLTELMSVIIKKNETIQQYGDRFTNLMRRTGRADDDETLIPVLIKGLMVTYRT